MTMRIYVGTYAKYNSGSIAGAWLDLEDYSDKEDFETACRELHKDEEDPEFMFQDFEGIPEGMVSESHIDEEAFELAQMSEADLEMFTAYRKHVDQDGTFSDAQDAFMGIYKNAEDFAYDYYEESGMLNDVPEPLRNYIDFKAIGRDMGYNGMHFVEVSYGRTFVFN
jgi:antirestriction protein